ncbi:hypothetical protein LXL04_034498 [Taraxacum kok-saghyz]
MASLSHKHVHELRKFNDARSDHHCRPVSCPLSCQQLSLPTLVTTFSLCFGDLIIITIINNQLEIELPIELIKKAFYFEKEKKQADSVDPAVEPVHHTRFNQFFYKNRPVHSGSEISIKSALIKSLSSSVHGSTGPTDWFEPDPVKPLDNKTFAKMCWIWCPRSQLKWCDLMNKVKVLLGLPSGANRIIKRLIRENLLFQESRTLFLVVYVWSMSGLAAHTFENREEDDVALAS